MSNILWQLESVGLGQRLREVTLRIESGVTAVLGHSGAGKTSFLNLLVGFEKPHAGILKPNLNRGSHRLPLFWVPADGGLWPHLTVAGHLAAVLAKDGDAEKQISHWLQQFDLQHCRERRPETLSAGERARLSVARALAADAAVLVMDEPMVHVDPGCVQKYWKVIRDYLSAHDVSLIFATHSPRAVLAEAQRVVCLRDGCIQYDGEVEALYWQASTPELAACLGEVNWLEPDSAQLWLQRSESTARGFRPEQISVQPDHQSPFVIESSRFQGAIAEVEVKHEPSGSVRTFYHRPSANHLARGTRIFLKALLACLLLVPLAGCGPASGPKLPVNEAHAWAVPTSGLLQPAVRSLTVGNNGEVIGLDTAARVLVYAPDGTLLHQWHMPENKNGNPEGVCVLKDGRVVVGDTHYHRVVIFAPDGKSFTTFGKEGQGPGEFIYPVAVAKDAQENLYIAEYGSNDRIQKFTSDGRFLLAFGGFGTKPGEFQRPSGLVWHDGKIYAADAFNNRIQIFSDDGKFLGVLDSKEQPLDLRLPYDLKLGSDNSLYAIEYGAGRVTRFDLAGRVLGRYGSIGSGLGQFATPWGIAVDKKNNIYIADTGNHRIVQLGMP